MRSLRGVLALLLVFPLAWMVGPVAADDADEGVPLPALELPPLLIQQLPPGYTQLPDQQGRLGPLDAGAAAAVLDQSGRVKADMLTKSGFRAGYSRAWAKQDSQDVVVDVLLEFGSDREARVFTRGFLTGRRQTTKAFEIVGVPEASGFERGPATPSRATPGQREVVMQRGRVLAILVLAGFASYPSPDTARALAEAQRASLATVPITADASDGGSKQSRAATKALALLLFTGVAWAMVRTLNRNPVVGGLPPSF